jgi:fructose-1,6-bisphosphatase/inositol monophosphatase family enzyme
METIDLVDAYTERPGEFDPTDILSGKAAAVVHQSCQAIDGGAIAFIATEAGAIMTDFAGNPPVSFRTSEKRTIPEIVVSTNKAIHDRILRALAAP